ncbi:MAG: UPF0175 family protein [Bacteroidota bacterium]
MGLVIPEQIIEQANMTPSEMLTELAVLLFLKKRLTLSQAANLAGLNQKAFQQATAGQKNGNSKQEVIGEAAKDNHRKPGWGKDIFKYVAPDFDETPEGFEDYMPA